MTSSNRRRFCPAIAKARYGFSTMSFLSPEIAVRT